MAYTFRHGDRPLEGVTIQRAVGRGGFGEVYYAVTDAGKEIALKYLRENPEVELRGVQQVMNLTSPHLVQIHDVRHNASGEAFVIMEYIAGPSLRDVLLAEPGPMPPAKAVFFAKGIAAGLNDLHAKGVVHRDLKPGNIFFDAGYVKIGDYGLSKHMGISQHSGQTASVGTAHYMAPEIGSGRYTRQVDIYALGVMLYEMLVGRLPFTGSSLQEVIIRQMRDEPDTSAVPAAFTPIVARALAKEPEERYSDVNEMADALEQLASADEHLSGFDPLTLSNIPRESDRIDADVTRTAAPPPPPVPTMDARAVPAAAVEAPYSDRYKTPDPESYAKPFFAAIAFCVFGVLFALVAAATGSREGALKLQSLAFVGAMIPGLMLLHKCWATLPSGWRRTTPRRAILFLFIPPIFIWWWWVAFHGLIIDMNRYRAAYAKDLPAVGHGWLITFWVLLAVTNGILDDEGPGALTFVLTAAAVTVVILHVGQITNLCEELARLRTTEEKPALAVGA